jgi:hypothetical protein
MELAGLEPAISWVRFRSAVLPNPLHKLFPGGRAARNPSDTQRLPGGVGDERPSIPKTSAASVIAVDEHIRKS